ncbi:MAG: helix-turn-helix domain-containing protein [Sedimentisphaerales bacterium]|jgi:hypothetical protein
MKIFSSKKTDVLGNVILNSKDAAELLGVGERQVMRLCKGGQFPGAKKCHGEWEIPLAVVQCYEREQLGKIRVDAKLILRVSNRLSLYLAIVGEEGRRIVAQIHALQFQSVLTDFDRLEIAKLEDKLRGINRYQGQIWSDFEKLGESLLLNDLKTEL